MIVAVGSTNPTKIDPVTEIFSHHFKNVKVKGVSVPSGVEEQPLSDDETYLGALNRAKNALKAVKGAKYGVGIEGGLHKFSYGWFERSLIVIVDRKGEIGIGASGGLMLPKTIIVKILQGKSLEQSIDEIFDTNKIGQGVGAYGVFTKGVISRAEGVKHGVAFALARFLHDSLY